MGSWLAYVAPGPLADLSVSPNAGSGASQVFAFRMTSPGGARFLFSGQALIHTGQAGYSVTWALFRKDANNQYVAADPTYGSLSASGVYQAPPGGTPTAYARATCSIGSYVLAPAYGEIQIRSYYPADCNYRVSLSDGNSVGRYVEMLLWQQNTGCSGQLQSPAPVDVLVSGANATSTAGQCHITYYPGGGQMLSLMDDTGLTPARPVTWYPVKALINASTEQVTNPGRGMTQNSQCLVDYARAWEKFGNPPQPLMKWNMPVYFHPSFVGGKDVKVREQSVATPWTSVNSLVPWTVPNLATDPPTGQIATPLENATVSRSQTLTFTGWALDNTLRAEGAIQSIKVYMDGEYLGLATLGQASTACGTYPGRPGCPNVGFTFSISGTSMGVGQHLFEFVVRDSDAPYNLLKVLSRRVTAQ